MKLGLMASGFGPRIEIDLELILEAERLGFDSVWTAEAWGNDAITPLAWIAAQTSTLKLGTAIMQMPARTPAMCAMQAMTVDQLSGGRMIVGLGPSGPQVIEGWHGVAYGKPLTRTREYVAIMRAIFAREGPVSFDGEIYQMPYKGEGASGLGKPLRSILHGRADIPIWTATISPKAISVAAEIADGFMPVWTSPSGMRTFEEPIKKGLAKAGNGKASADFDIFPMTPVIVDDNVDGCRDFVRPAIALYVGGMGARSKNFYNDHVSRQGWPDAAREIQDLYLDSKKGEAAAAVPDDLVDEIALIGPKERIHDKLQEWGETRVTGLLVNGANAAALRTMAELCF